MVETNAVLATLVFVCRRVGARLLAVKVCATEGVGAKRAAKNERLPENWSGE